MRSSINNFFLDRYLFDDIKFCYRLKQEFYKKDNVIYCLRYYSLGHRAVPCARSCYKQAFD